MSRFRCDYSSKYNHRLTKHIDGVHKKLRPFPCEIRNKPFQTKDQLKRHVSCVHEKLKPFSCESCEMTFGTKREVKSHIMHRHFQENESRIV